jgi:environmental stress-induced protein Ves
MREVSASATPLVYEFLPRSGHREMPWRNGGGSTLEVVRYPSSTDGGPLEWRVSVARIDRPGPFSELPVDRVIMPIGEAGMSLHLDGKETVLDPWQQIAFPGEVAVRAELRSASTRCLNLMTWRGGFEGGITVLSGREADAVSLGMGEQAVVVAVSGCAAFHDGGHGANPAMELGAMDAVRAVGPGAFSVGGAGPVAVVRIGRAAHQLAGGG